MPVIFTAETASKRGAEGQAKSVRSEKILIAVAQLPFKWQNWNQNSLLLLGLIFLIYSLMCSVTITGKKRKTDRKAPVQTQLDPIWVFPHSLSLSLFEQADPAWNTAADGLRLTWARCWQYLAFKRTGLYRPFPLISAEFEWTSVSSVCPNPPLWAPSQLHFLPSPSMCSVILLERLFPHRFGYLDGKQYLSKN